MNIGKELKKLREENHLTQREVAEKLGISQGSYATWENKKTNQTLKILEKVADFYGIPLQKFFIDDNQSQDFIGSADNYVRLHQDQKEVIVDLTKVMVEKNKQLLEVRETAPVYEIKTYRKKNFTKLKFKMRNFLQDSGQVSKITMRLIPFTPIHLLDAMTVLHGLRGNRWNLIFRMVQS